MRSSRVALAVVAGLFFAAPAMPASLSLSPVGLDLPADAKAGAIALTNRAGTPINLQIRVFRWTQIDGEDRLEPTSDVIASPPAATVPAGSTYTIRVARVAERPVTGSESYRLIIDELPQPRDARTAPQAVSMVLRTSIPVFFNQKSAVADMQWAIARDESGPYLTATNVGGRYIKLSNLAVESASGRLAVADGLAGYVLPGASRRFELDREKTKSLPLRPGEELTITARAGKINVRDKISVPAN